jgi:membrane-associated PAP2 superfamily phosphatase
MLTTRTVLLGAALLCLAALSIFVLARFTDIDLVLADALYDRAAGAFPWRDAWLTDTFSHHILKAALTGLGAPPARRLRWAWQWAGCSRCAVPTS